MINTVDTIFAQSSNTGKSGVAIFRISGPNSIFAIDKLLKSNQVVKLKPRLMSFKKIYDPTTGDLIDHAMVVYFQSPSSFTGEDVVEIYTHGSIAISAMIIKSLLNLGIRLAEPGEFTKRAFINGKFDLTAAEGIADLIDAETSWQHKQAMQQVEGALADLYSSWRKQLLSVISLLEAYIDFPDEQIPNEVLNQVQTVVETLRSTIQNHLDDNRRGELLRSGIRLTILGEPNVGKSSLLNFLVQREIAITSEIPGTTRDIIEGHLDIGGYPIILQDTAGIRSSTKDVIEQEGIKRALQSAQNADIKIIMTDARSSLLSQELHDLIDDNTIIVINKIDLQNHAHTIDGLKISVTKKIGLKALLQAIEKLASTIAGSCESPCITNERHRYQLTLALSCLDKFNLNDDLVLATEDIRMAMRYLSMLTGKITVDEILGEIFSNFCIGK